VQLDPGLNARRRLPRIRVREAPPADDDGDDEEEQWLDGSSSGAGSSMDDVSGSRDVATPLRPLKINQDLLIVSFVCVLFWGALVLAPRRRRPPQQNSPLLLLHPPPPNQTKPNQTKPNQTKPNQTKPTQSQYRSRLARVQAAITADRDERRQLLRTAEEGLRRALALDASDGRPYVVLGKLLVSQRRFDEARKLYAEGTANTGSRCAHLWCSWGHMEGRCGNLARARKLLDAALVVDPSHAAAWHAWGMLEYREGNYLRARDLWTRGIQRCRGSPTRQTAYLHCSLAVMAAELGRLGEARAWFEEGTRANGGGGEGAGGARSCALWHAWAVAEARAGDPDGAVRYLFKRALAANPRSRYAHLAWAVWEARRGNRRTALQLLARGSALNPADAALLQAWACAEREAGRPDAARALFRRAVAADPAHVHAWQAWGVMEARLGNADEARRLFQQGVWAEPSGRGAVRVFHAWAVLEWRSGAHARARELFKAALRVDPRSDAAWSTWIAMEEALDRLGAADELRIRRAERQWEFVVPPSFTTRPPGMGGGGMAASSASSSSSLGAVGGGLSSSAGVQAAEGAAGLASSSASAAQPAPAPEPGTGGAAPPRPSPLGSLISRINDFFAARPGLGLSITGAQQWLGPGFGGDAGAATGDGATPPEQRSMRELLPADFRDDLTPDDVIGDAGATSAASDDPAEEALGRLWREASQAGWGVAARRQALAAAGFSASPAASLSSLSSSSSSEEDDDDLIGDAASLGRAAEALAAAEAELEVRQRGQQQRERPQQQREQREQLPRMAPPPPRRRAPPAALREVRAPRSAVSASVAAGGSGGDGGAA
jgi:tetratricopeptide (TPR) repeat protein